MYAFQLSNLPQSYDFLVLVLTSMRINSPSSSQHIMLLQLSSALPGALCVGSKSQSSQNVDFVVCASS